MARAPRPRHPFVSPIVHLGMLEAELLDAPESHAGEDGRLRLVGDDAVFDYGLRAVGGVKDTNLQRHVVLRRRLEPERWRQIVVAVVLPGRLVLLVELGGDWVSMPRDEINVVHQWVLVGPDVV
eukprot:5536542-Pyramimonas_sp.AAC.1